MYLSPSPHVTLPAKKFDGNNKMGFDEVSL